MNDEINKLLSNLLSKMQNILGVKLRGLYLYGSLATDDFNLDVSDIDLLAVLDSAISQNEFEKLKKMHDEFTKDHNEWDDRIEVQYMTKSALETFKTKESNIAAISPGEPFHIKKVGKHWLMNWYMVREKGLTLFGPDPKTIIPPISKVEFIESVKDHTKSWNKWVENMHSKKGQSYAILTLCRAFYAVKNGEQTSKEQAAEWVKRKLPQWSKLIDIALDWRKEKDGDIENKETFGKTEKFVNFIRDLIINTK